MLFTSLEFFAFVPLTLLLFAALPARGRWAWLLVASYFFYSFWQPSNLVYLGAVTLVVWACGRALERTALRGARRGRPAAGLAAVLGSLFAFKFYDFVAGELERLAGEVLASERAFSLPRIGLATPVGYSFYAFSAASYLVDIFLRRLAGGGSAGPPGPHAAWFPTNFAGPTGRAPPFLPQLAAGLRADPDRAVLGLQLIGWGLIKKV